MKSYATAHTLHHSLYWWTHKMSQMRLQMASIKPNDYCHIIKVPEDEYLALAIFSYIGVTMSSICLVLSIIALLTLG